MVRHLPTVVQSGPQPPVWSSGPWRSSSGPGPVVGPSGRDVSGAKQREPLRFPTNSGLQAQNERPPKNSRLRMVSWFIDLPQRGGALVKTDVTVHPDWTGLPWVRPFWAGPRPGTGEARPLHACGLVKKELERLEKPNRNCDSEDSVSEKRASRDNRWTVVRCCQRTEGCKRSGTVDRNGGWDRKIYYPN